MKKYAIFFLCLTALFSCQKDDALLSNNKSIKGRTTSEELLQTGVTGTLSLLYRPLKDLTSNQREDVFASQSNFESFLSSKSIDEEEVYEYFDMMVDATEDLISTNPQSYLEGIAEDTFLDYMDHIGEGEGEPQGLGLPCTDQYVEDVQEAASAMIGCLLVAPEAAYGCVGTAIIGAISAWGDFLECLDETYP